MKFIGFSNVFWPAQCVFMYDKTISVLAGEACMGKTVKIHHGGTLVADGTIPSAGLAVAPTVASGDLTIHDAEFDGFAEGETYTITIGDADPVNGYRDSSTAMATCDLSAFWFICDRGQKAVQATTLPDLADAPYVIAKTNTVTTKKYDIKQLPDECLPDTAARAADVAKLQVAARSAQSTAETAQSTAETAQSTAETAQSTAVSAGSCWPGTSYFPVETSVTLTDAFSAAKDLNGYHLILGEKYSINEDPNCVWQNGAMQYSRNGAYASIGWKNGEYTFQKINLAKATITGRFMKSVSRTEYQNRFCTLPPYVVLPGFLMASSSTNSAKLFRITVDDSGTISATEVTT